MKTTFSILLLLTLVIGQLSCKRSQKSEEPDSLQETMNCSIPDGSYSARVSYENSSTGCSSVYTLEVDIINNELSVLHFPNRGYLDEDHISSQYQDANCSIHLIDDRDRDFTIQILN